MRRSLKVTLAQILRRIAAELHLNSRYRPELHYMRGPGPNPAPAPRFPADGKVSAASRGGAVR